MYKKPFIIAEAGCNHMGRMDIAKDLMGFSRVQDAVGGEIVIDGRPFTVIGVIRDTTDSGIASFMGVQYAAYIPHTTFIRLPSARTTKITSFTLSAKNGDLEQAQEDIGQLLLERFENDEDAFYVMNFQSILDGNFDIPTLRSTY